MYPQTTLKIRNSGKARGDGNSTMGTRDVRVTFWSSGETGPRTGYGLNTGFIRVEETVRKMEACLQGSNQA